MPTKGLQHVIHLVGTAGQLAKGLTRQEQVPRHGLMVFAGKIQASFVRILSAEPLAKH